MNMNLSASRLPLYFSLTVWGALFLLPLLLDEFTLSQFAIFFSYGLFAMSLALVWGQAGLLCLGQAIFFGLGAYSMSLVSMDMVPWLDWANDWHMALGVLSAVLVPMLIAYFIAMLLFNGSRLDGAFLGLVTLALAVVAERLFEHWRYAGGANGLFGIPSLSWGNEDNPLTEKHLYYVGLVICCITAIVLYQLTRSNFGLLLKAIRENETRTNHLGVNTIRIKTMTFVLAAGIAGLAGALFVTQFYFVSPNLVGFGLSTEVLIWVAVGGRFSFTAAFLGAISVRLLESYLGDYFGHYWQLILGFIFVIIVMYFPKGIYGKLLASR